MKFGSLFKVIKDHDTAYILYSDFVSFIKSHEPALRLDNVKRTLNQHGKKITVLNGLTLVPVSSVLKYCFKSSDASRGCQEIVNIIEQELVKQNNDCLNSFELYKLISKTKFSNIEFAYETVHIRERDITTLISEHKPHFSEREWQKIVWFEHHFFVTSKCDLYESNYENIIELKYSKFQSLLTFKECADKVLRSSKQQICDKNVRIQEASDCNSVEIVASKRHIPLQIENEILSIFNRYVGEDNAKFLCYDTDESQKNNCIRVVGVVPEELDIPNKEDLCQRVYYSIRRKHELHIETIQFASKTALHKYVEDDAYERFLLRDDIDTNQVRGIFWTWNSLSVYQNIDSADNSELNEKCHTCFGDTVDRGLTVKTFDILQEWYLETPAEIQLLLEVFINKRSLRNTDNDGKFVENKLTKLYHAYDTFLNILNKNFIGIHQQANTEELLIEYKNVSSVFDVTSSIGATASLRHADSQLKQKSTEELCYYNTYIKQHQFKFVTTTGSHSETTCLRQCHVILMLDNLVRLTYKADPIPGENRSNQICMLPITLQGLPLHADITSTWHTADCDGTDDCACKKTVELAKEDAQTILDLQPPEKHTHRQFKRLMIWGTSRLWLKITDEILSYLDDERPPSHTDANQLLEETVTNDETITETEISEENIDLQEIIEKVELVEDSITEYEESTFQETHNNRTLDEEILFELDMSFQNVSLNDPTEHERNTNVQSLLLSFGFEKFEVPNLLCKHPPPAVGRDDDLHKIKEILDDVLLKMGYITNPQKLGNRILCGPDHKIGKSLLRLMEMDTKYRSFIPEFPLLHLRKSLITILFSAYQDAGLLQLLQYMRDERGEDWKKLASATQIDNATKFVRRIALAFHLAFIVAFARSLDDDDKEAFVCDMDSSSPLSNADTWEQKYDEFIAKGTQTNATFAMHVDIMRHCDCVVATAFAERLGGPDGYSLLLAAVKESLCFLFVNNATSYAPYSVKLLYEHLRAGFYHQELKKALFSTPIKDSKRNFACDTKREMDHIDALKAFRSGSNTETITCRMSLLDSLNEVKSRGKNTTTGCSVEDKLGMEITDTDILHILPTAELILRQGGLQIDEDDVPRNVYTKKKICLPKTLLDSASEDTGKYLLTRYMIQEGMFNLNIDDLPSADTIHGPKELVSRAVRSKGTTIKRTVKSKVQTEKSEREIKEVERLKVVEKQRQVIDCLSSSANACQTFLKADSSKPKVMKSVGMQRALKSLVLSSLATVTISNNSDMSSYISLKNSQLPQNILRETRLCIVEFAGIKFKGASIKTGKDYVKMCEGFCMNIVICEEKYGYTPDDLKANTRMQRKSKDEKSVDHLKLGNKIINEQTFDREALTKTEIGKTTISTYLAKNIDSLRINANVHLIVDSELNSIETEDKYCTPLSVRYHKQGPTEYEQLHHVHQKKGEAEMAVADWLIHLQDSISIGHTITILVTSGDIDAVYIMLYVVSKYWKRNHAGKFLNQIYTILQKPNGTCDYYNVTSILELLETTYQDKDIGTKLALSLCLGGNDFFPKAYMVSHESVVRAILDKPYFISGIFEISDTISVNVECFKDLFKFLFCPKRYAAEELTYDQVRAISIGKSEDPVRKSGYRTNDPRRWLPPESVMERLAELFQLQVEYLETAGIHDAELLQFSQSRCISISEAGEVGYDFGPEAQFGDISELPSVPILPGKRPKQAKRTMPSTPQHGARRKRRQFGLETEMQILASSTPKSKCN